MTDPDDAELRAAVLAPGTEPRPDDHVRGLPDAPVTVLEYGDYECAYCAAAEPVLRRVLDETAGQVRLVFRNYPLFETHPYALTAALAAEAAGAQGRFWEMHDLLFDRQGVLTDAALKSYADELGLDGDRIVGEAAQAYGDKVEADFSAGVLAEVPGTPTLFIQGELYTGRLEVGALLRAVNAAAPGPAGSRRDGGLDPRARRQRRWPFGLRRAQGEPLAEDAEEDDAEQGRGD